jgi:hypothetical protein
MTYRATRDAKDEPVCVRTTSQIIRSHSLFRITIVAGILATLSLLLGCSHGAASPKESPFYGDWRLVPVKTGQDLSSSLATTFGWNSVYFEGHVRIEPEDGGFRVTVLDAHRRPVPEASWEGSLDGDALAWTRPDWPEVSFRAWFDDDGTLRGGLLDEPYQGGGPRSTWRWEPWEEDSSEPVPIKLTNSAFGFAIEAPSGFMGMGVRPEAPIDLSYSWFGPARTEDDISTCFGIEIQKHPVLTPHRVARALRKRLSLENRGEVGGVADESGSKLLTADLQQAGERPYVHVVREYSLDGRARRSETYIFMSARFTYELSRFMDLDHPIEYADEFAELLDSFRLSSRP